MAGIFETLFDVISNALKKPVPKSLAMFRSCTFVEKKEARECMGNFLSLFFFRIKKLLLIFGWELFCKQPAAEPQALIDYYNAKVTTVGEFNPDS
jgi:hypothetical protein